MRLFAWLCRAQGRDSTSRERGAAARGHRPVSTPASAAAPPATPVPPAPLDTEVLIIGAGLGGLCAAIQLQRAGFRYALLERAAEVGGTWRDNTYPGCACDIPSVLYSLSFEPNPHWTRAYPQQAEIQAYILRVVERHGLRAHLHTGVDVQALRYDEAAQRWHVTAQDGRVFSARFVVLATGPFTKPALPQIDGLANFAGPVFHSMQWRHDVPLQGKRVAVIGTGASAIQFVPELAKVAAQVSVFQRTPPWVVPRPDKPYSVLRRRLQQAVPPLQRLARWGVYWRNELLALGFLGNRPVQALARALASGHLRRAIPEPALRAQLTPDYSPGCKRILVSNDWYPTLRKPHVQLVSAPILHVTADAVVTCDGTPYAADVLVFGTGFRLTEFVAPMTITGRGGVELQALWRTQPAATWLGICTHGFPNLFALVGPNTGLGHNSIVFMIEAQMRWVLKALQHARRRGVGSVEVRAEVQQAQYAQVQQRMARTVWASGCHSYYQSAGGRIDTLWPGFTWQYWLRCARFRAGDFTLLPAAG
ncbi:MAG: NAD(P)/FAD-dependent oxidoreductase [Betaproteobacteria bacterium]|nr:NAD(P)/FAD-dependent oxidoreductase [Betaproteobacteria bacterium]